MLVPNSAARDPTEVSIGASRPNAEVTRPLQSPAQMTAVSNEGAQLLTIQELSRRSRLSIATIHRLKKAERIPYFQPSGKGGRLLFPVDAIERSGDRKFRAAETGQNDTPGDQRLPGPRPAWMR